ncbi:ABC transporter [Geodermatophilus sp. YIM 151500]|uniref:GTPase domain-containing protein n=1 Tax=Geodermatophilus sp. YIM 151500 TaxID=2984531 RepID=UPI0021E3CDD7|nr:ABC transporter [Geodermatophilus sp. YIM 151500]MCV2491781.1 ABC transporter [Geodermatophilus sp. YIM 151500]
MTAAAPTVPDALETLRDRVAELSFGLAVPGRADAAREARAVVDQVDDYLLPRLRDLDAPLLAVVGGSTGAGKSTLVNSLLHADVTRAGVLRPTTRAPVLVCAPADRAAFAGDRVLPHLARTTGAPGGPDDGHGALRLVAHDALPAGLALLDAPDVDSVVTANRDLAAQLLAAADLWIFVTTAARYADAVPWDLLHTAVQRGTAVAVVLDRVPPEARDEVADDLAGMLRRAGLSAARLFVVAERPLDGGLLPAEEIAPLRAWLLGLAADQEQRDAVVRQTLAGALDSLSDRVTGLLAAEEQQHAAARTLQEAADAAYARARQEVDDAVAGGALLRGEVLARWQEFVGTGEWMRGLQASVGRLRDRIGSAMTGRRTSPEQVQASLGSSVADLLQAAADSAAERTATSWRSLPGGTALLAGRERDLEAASPDFPDAAVDEVRDWQGEVLELVRSEGAGKRARARWLSWGVNGAGAVVMVAVFASTGGLTGGEVAVAGGTTAVGQRLLEAVLGDAAVRSLAARARADLRERAGRLLDTERARFADLVTAAAPAPDGITRLRAAADGLATARRSR